MASSDSLARNTANAILEDLVAAEQLQRRTLESEVQALRKVLNEIAEGIAPDVVETAIKQGHDPQDWAAHEWKTALPKMLKNAITHFGAMADDRLEHQAQALARLQSRTTQLETTLETLRQEHQQVLQASTQKDEQLRQLWRKNTDLTAVLESTQDQSAAHKTLPQESEEKEPIARTPDTPVVIDKGYPEIPTSFDKTAAIATFGPQHYRRDAKLLFLLGKTGRSRRPWLMEGIAYYEHLKDGKSGSLRRLLDRLARMDLVKIIVPNETKANIIQLTECGKQAYTTIYGAQPAISEVERLLEGHQPNGIEHAGLALAAAQFLEDLGWSVMIAPPAVMLPDGHRLEPDLLLTADDKRCYVEVEWARGPASNRTAKWRNLFKLQGAVYLVTGDPQKCQELVTEVLALNTVGQIYATDLKTLHKLLSIPDAPIETSSVWAIQNEIRI